MRDLANSQLGISIFDYDSDDGPLFFKKVYHRFTGPGSSTQRQTVSLMEDALDWAKSNGHTQIAQKIASDLGEDE